MTSSIRSVVKELKRDGVATVIVEQQVDAVTPVADRVAFVENGQHHETVAAAQLRADPSLVERYLGVGV